MSLFHRIMYLRDSYQIGNLAQLIVGNPVGCVAIKLHKGRRSAEYQLSVLNPLDRFDRTLARQLALGRMVEAPFTVSLPPNATQHQISRAVMEDIAYDVGAPGRARRAAKLWLRRNR